MVVVVVPQCARCGRKESAEGPASYRGLGPRHAVAATGPGLASGLLVPAFREPFIGKVSINVVYIHGYFGLW